MCSTDEEEAEAREAHFKNLLERTATYDPDVVNLIEEIVGGIVNCEGEVISNLSKFSIRRRSLQCNETNITVIKTIRIHLNGVIPWVHKYPSLKVFFHFLFIFFVQT